MEFELPDLAGFVAAGFLLLIACALGLLGALLANTLGHAPVIGGWVSRDLVGWIDDARNAVLRAAHATWHFAAGMFNWASDVLIKPFEYQVIWAGRAWNWLHQLFTQTIPDAYNDARNYALSLADRAEADAVHLYDAAVADADRLTAAAEARATQLFRDGETYAAGLVTAAERSLVSDIRAAEAAAAAGLASAEHALTAAVASVASAADKDLAALAGQVNTTAGQLARDIITEVQQAESTAAANLAAVQAGIYTDLETWGDKAVAVAWPDAAGDIESLRRTLGGDFPWLDDLAGALAGAGAAGLLGALIRSLAGVHAITDLANDCIVPNCRNLSGLGNDLQQLLSAGSAAAMIAWLVFAVTDPAGAAADIQSVALNPLRDVITGASHLFGGP